MEETIVNNKKKRKLEKEYNRHLQKRLRRYVYQRIEERQGNKNILIKTTLEKANEITGKQDWYKEQNKEVQLIWSNTVALVWKSIGAEIDKEGYKNVRLKTKAQIEKKAPRDHNELMNMLKRGLLDRLDNLPNK